MTFSILIIWWDFKNTGKFHVSWNESTIYKDLWTKMFITASFIAVKHWKQTEHFSVKEQWFCLYHKLLCSWCKEGEREKEEGGWRRGKERKRGKEGKGEGNLSGGISVWHHWARWRNHIQSDSIWATKQLLESYLFIYHPHWCLSIVPLYPQTPKMSLHLEVDIMVVSLDSSSVGTWAWRLM